MKTCYLITSILILSTLFSSCKKEVDSENPSNSSSAPLPVVFTSNLEYVDEGHSVSINGTSNYHSNASLTATTSGEILDGSLLNLKFIDKVTQAELYITIIENDGESIHSGTYSFSSPYNDFGFSFQLHNPNSDMIYDYQSSYNTQNLEYNGQTTIPNGTITITSLTQNSISGTINAELYHFGGSFQNLTHKAIISNGEFSCDIVRF